MQSLAGYSALRESSGLRALRREDHGYLGGSLRAGARYCTAGQLSGERPDAFESRSMPIAHFKRETPISIYLNRPTALCFSLQGMQAKAWNVHVV
jgi:hypothetical protein